MSLMPQDNLSSGYAAADASRNPTPTAISRALGDVPAMRRAIYDQTYLAASQLPAVSNNKYTLNVRDVHWADPDTFTNKQRKEAILTGGTLARRLRGTWVLSDAATGKEVERRTATLARVPHLTENGTFVFRGSDYAVSNQQRMRPGVYIRRKENGEIEAHANVLQGGPAHHYEIDPDKGVFYMRMGTSRVPLMPILRAMHATDQELREAWGADLFAANYQKNDDAALGKLRQRLLREETMDGDHGAKVVEAMAKMQFDPDVNRRTLGTAHAALDKAAVLAVTRKLLAVQRGEQDPDDRDHQAYQHIMAPEDLFSEHLAKDRAGVRRQLLYKLTFGDRGLAGLPAAALQEQIDSTLLSSGLGQAVEESNPSEILDKLTKVSRMGEGGIASLNAVPDEARNVSASQYGFIDLTRTPESEKTGVDTFFAAGTRKGRDGRIYAKFSDRQGRAVWKSPQDLAEATVGFPGVMELPEARVPAIKRGRMTYVRKREIDFLAPPFETSFSPLGNLVPLKSMTKAQRIAMGSRMATQALPLAEPEAPLVQTGIPGSGGQHSYEDKYGRHMGAVRASAGGRVLGVTPDGLDVRYDDGTKASIPLDNMVPYNRRTFRHQTPLVQAGDRFTSGQLLARSNYTDKQGSTALGLNARVAYLPWHGRVYEDAAVISESMAKRLTSENLYQHQLEVSDRTITGKRKYIGLFPGRFDRKTLETLDDEGVIRPGTQVRYGDPLILGASEKAAAANKLHKKNQPGYSDASVTWDHHDPGVVTDIAMAKEGPVVVVRSLQPMQVGDKMCYDTETEVLTDNGWVNVAAVTCSDRVASLTPGGVLEYVAPVAVRAYPHAGRMYHVETPQVDLCVTENHMLYALTRTAEYAAERDKRSAEYSLVRADQVYGKRYRLKNNAVWEGQSPEFIEIFGPAARCGRNGPGTRQPPSAHLPLRTYLMLLGAYLSAGSCTNRLQRRKKAGWLRIVKIHQVKPSGVARMRAELVPALRGCGISCSVTRDRLVIRSAQLAAYFHDFGVAREKRIPAWVFGLRADDLMVLYDWLMRGDGCAAKTSDSYHTTSKGLADDFQRLCLHIGWAARPYLATPAAPMRSKGKLYECCDRYAVAVYKHKNRPTVNRGHSRPQQGQKEEWIDYCGLVHCVTLPRNHVLYVRRNGKACWSGNSGRFGDKSVVSEIVPDDQMPHDTQGKPYEVLVSPTGLISRTNAAQWAEAKLGEIARKTGRPIKVEDFDAAIPDRGEWVRQQMLRHGIPDTEDAVDPSTGRKIPGVYSGTRFFMKLQHQAESKGQGRSGGGYGADEAPAKGGTTGSKRISLLDSNSLLSHGAVNVLRDAGAVRGQKNDEYWMQFMQGYTPRTPRVPLVYEKFVNQLKSAGINVVRDGAQMHIMALTDKDLDKLAGDRELQNAETVTFDKGLEPIKGGLFDETITGGHRSGRWSAIRLAEPMPSPVMEEPIRRVLGLTQKKFEAVLSGKEQFRGDTGPAAIGTALKNVNLDAAIALARAAVTNGTRSARDEAVRRLGYLKSAKQLGIHPGDWMLKRAPVLPPQFRPVSTLGDSRVPLVPDANYLYKELFEANDNLRKMSEATGGKSVGDERLAVYNAFKAVVGLGDPVTRQNQERQLQGVLRKIFGDSPKLGAVQRQLISSTVDNVGRAVVVPDPDLDLDEVGLPEDKAFDVYQRFIVRRLRRSGLPITEALKHVRDRSPLARKTLESEMEERPVLVNRAPVLHRFGIMAFRPKLTAGSVLRVPPAITKGFNMDFDGDAVQYHVPADEEARKEALERMLPSRQLISVADFKTPMPVPTQEYPGGLFAGTSKLLQSKRAPRTFRNVQDVRKAWLAGEIGINDQVRVLS